MIQAYGKSLSKLKVATLYGGQRFETQLEALRAGPQVVVGTPGRVMEHLRRQTVSLDHVLFAVIDEADEMLRMGFLEAVEFVLEALPEDRQIALFSATMPEPIQRVSKRFLNDPVTLHVEAATLTVDHIEQFWIRVPQRRKLEALMRVLNGDPSGATLIFTRTRKGCAEVADGLTAGGIAADANA
jgi:ATP-dependent RNA helicase DeaD